jgi:hypothetical protein
MPEPFKRYPYVSVRDQIRSGDILMCSGNGFFSNLIKKATKSKWSHVGILLKIPEVGRTMVLESVETRGVQSVPLSSYIKDYNASGHPYAGELAIFRHKLFNPERLPVASEKAIDLLGYRYDNKEILRIFWRIQRGKFRFYHKDGIMPRDNKEYICSEYVYQFFQNSGIEIQHDSRGFVSPGCFAKDYNIEYLFDIY